MLASNQEWKQWGRRDPLFAVSSWPGREREGSCPWTDQEFYALGADFDDFDSHWRGYGRGQRSCLEIGCGAGRITNRLAVNFERVIATDVSEGMLEYAQAHVHAPNVDWHLTDGESLPCADAGVSAVFSCHVFQHLPNFKAGAAIFAEVHRVLEPGGSFMIHLPLFLTPDVHRAFMRSAEVAQGCYDRLLALKAGLMRWRMRFGGKPYMHGTAYPARALYLRLSALGFQDVEFAAFQVRPSMSLHTCVLGRKPAPPFSSEPS